MMGDIMTFPSCLSIRLIGMAVVMPAALILGGCVATTTAAPVDVTRFHVDGGVRSGTINILADGVPGRNSLEFGVVAAAVSAALARTGFTVRTDDPDNAEFHALVSLDRTTYQTERRRSPVSVGVGGSTGSYGSGLGLGIGINLSGKPKPVVAMRLKVQIRRASDGAPVWEGRAESSAKEGTPDAQSNAMAGKLTEALFRDYPGQSGETITLE